MFGKIIVLFALAATASAAPAVPVIAASAPVVAAPALAVPYSTSYSSHSVTRTDALAAPAVAAVEPLAYTAPALAAYSAPVAYTAQSSVAYSAPYTTYVF